MLENEPTGGPSADTTSAEHTAEPAPRRRATRRAPKAAPGTGDGTAITASADPVTPETPSGDTPSGDTPAEAPAAKAPAKRTRRPAKKAAPVPATESESPTAADTTPAGDASPAADPTAAAVASVAVVEASPDGDAPAPAKTARKAAPRKRAPRKAAPAAATETDTAAAEAVGTDAPATGTATAEAAGTDAPATGTAAAEAAGTDAPEKAAPAKRTRRSRSRAAATAETTTDAESAAAPDTAAAGTAADAGEDDASSAAAATPPAPPMALFVAPDAAAAPAPRKRAARRAAGPAEPVAEEVTEPETDEDLEVADETDEESEGGTRRRRRGRRGRGRGKGGDEAAAETGDEEASAEAPEAEQDAESDEDEDDKGGTSRRRRRRRRGSGGGDAEGGTDEPANTVVKVREPRSIVDEVQGVKGSTRLEAKRQRRRDGRDQGRRRPPVLSEAEFLARREAVERTMVVRQIADRTQIAVLEDGVLVEHYVTKASNTSYAGNVYLGKVQNVLPSMEAAFVDIGKGRNAVLYAGEVNWDAAGMEGKPRKIEQALKSGDPVLVQVTKDPIGHKGARLTSQISLPGRFLVYVPEGQMTGISRKLPDTERKRLKDILKKIVPENAGVIVRTAAEGASEEELTRDVARLEAQWETIRSKAEKGQAPALLYAEPDLVIRVIRDIFNEDFSKLVVSGDEAWETVQQYVQHVSPDLVDRLSRHTADTDVFADLRVDEQITKALDRKVWLPSGGSLVIDRTEAMTVVDVNTGKFTGQGGNLEETVTRNNLEAAEEIVRQLRLRDIGGMIVIDFIDMVLEGNRDLVLRRLTECLGRDRTKHQVAEVTSLGLVQMTRKRVGQGLFEAFSETCEHCKGRGVHIRTEPVDRARPQGAKPQPPKPTPPLPRPAATADETEAAEATAGTAETTAGTGEDGPAPEPRSRRRRGRGKGTAEAEVASAEAGAKASEADAAPAEAGAGAAEVTAAGADERAGSESGAGTEGTEPWPAVPVPAPTVASAVAPEPAGAVVSASGGDGASAGYSVPPAASDDAAEATVSGNGSTPSGDGGAPPRRRRRAASRPAGPPVSTP